MKAKTILTWLLSFVVLCSFLSFNALAQTTHEPITQQLITMVEHNSDLKTMLVKSIKSAHKKNGDSLTNPVSTLNEYYAFVDWAAKAMPWSIIPNIDRKYPKLYDQIDQSLDYFYFINDQPLRELKDKGYYHNSLQYFEPYRTWLIEFTKEWGLFLSQPGSWNEKYYQKAYEDESFGLKKGWYEEPSHWKTFNDFFARYLKSPDVRPIASPDDPSIVASPADSTPQGVWKINKNSYIIAKSGKSGVTIKSNTFRSIPILIGKGSAYRNSFAGGMLTHTFLDVNDYHRYHFPVSGTIKEVRVIPSDDAVGGIITWNKKLQKYVLSSKTPEWQNIETRGCVIIETEKYGLVALLPIGMSQVSSVNFEKTVKVGAKVNKGDMLGYFLFGGSDFILLFQRKVEFKLTVPKDKNDKSKYEHILMGTKYGEISIKK